MKLKTAGILLVLFSVLSLSAFAQKGYGEFSEPVNVSSKKRALKLARRNSENADFTIAIQRYRELLKADPENVTYNTELGMTFFDSPYQKVMCIPYLEKAIKNGKMEIVGELYYPLAVAYRMKGDYNKALEAFGQYLNQLKAYGSYLEPKEELALTDEVSREIEICNNAKSLRGGPQFTITKDSIEYFPVTKRFPSPINSIYDEYSPVFTNGDSTIIFTARRKGSTGEKINWDGKYFEDIFYSDFNGTTWSEPKPFEGEINTSGHDAVNSISRDKKKLYIYRAVKNGSIMVAESEGRNKWSEPKPLEGDVNSRAWETSLGVSLHDSVVYFVSDRKGGYGGRDIYMSRKDKNGNWSEGSNLGGNVNTIFEEDAPFLSADGKYLYFASQGHNTMGGFDIYRSEKVNNEWQVPQNLGEPINTENHDIYLLFSENGEKAWLSSQRITNDTLNDMNLFEISFECKTIAAVNLNGLITDAESGKGLKGKIVAKDEAGNETTADADVNGIYRLKLIPERKYSLNIFAGDFKSQEASINIPKQCKSYDLFQNISVRYVTEGGRISKQETVVRNGFFDVRKESGKTSPADQAAFLADKGKSVQGYSEQKYEQELKEAEVISTTEISFVNILFDYNSAGIRKDAVETLDNVAKFLKENKSAIIELWGFADAKGTEQYNLELSNKRAKAAMNYLQDKGIKKSRLKLKGFGEAQPISENESEEGRQKNRRVEFKVFPKGDEERK